MKVTSFTPNPGVHLASSPRNEPTPPPEKPPGDGFDGSVLAGIGGALLGAAGGGYAGAALGVFGTIAVSSASTHPIEVLARASLVGAVTGLAGVGGGGYYGYLGGQALYEHFTKG